MPRFVRASNSVFLLMILAVAIPAAGQKHGDQKLADKSADLPAVIWRDPGDVASLNLLYGAGGSEHAPDPAGTFTFVKEDMEGTSPKFDVTDSQGIAWKVKMGQEPQAETAATRLLWAVGYFVDEDYYLADLKVEGLPKLRRGEEFVSAGDVVHRVRLKRKGKEIKKIGNWDWFNNPFVGTKELNGLRVMMALLNNWDLKKVNNEIYAVDDEQRYVVSDLGASFGKTGNPMTRSKGNLKGYEESYFISRESPAEVDFVMHSRPFFLTALDVPNYRERSDMERITKHIPRADAKWIGQQLARLSDDQIHDCFRAAGYSLSEVDGFSKVVEKRIAELNKL